MAQEKTIKLVYGTTVSYQSTTLSDATKVSDFAKDNNLLLPGASLQLNGSVVSADHLNKTFGELLNGASEATLMSVVNSKNA